MLGISMPTIQLLNKVPNKIFIACSGGVDSICALSFFSQKKYRHIDLLFVDHNTKASAEAKEFLFDEVSFRFEKNVSCFTIAKTKPKKESWEEFWRNERYRIFHAMPDPVVTAHHLNDAMETWLFTALNGDPKLIPYRNKNVIRPFLMTEKSQMINWCERKGLSWIEDESNSNVDYARNRIRHNIMPEALKVNPGLAKVIKKKYLQLRG